MSNTRNTTSVSQLLGVLLLAVTGFIAFAPADYAVDYTQAITMQTWAVLNELPFAWPVTALLPNAEVFSLFDEADTASNLSDRLDIAACLLIALEVWTIRLSLAVVLSIPAAVGGWIAASSQAALEKRHGRRVPLSRRHIEHCLLKLFFFPCLIGCLAPIEVQYSALGIWCWAAAAAALAAREKAYKNPD